MRSIGMDVHRSFAQVAIHEDGITAKSFRLELEHDTVVAFGKDLRPDDEVVLEATGNTAAIVRLLTPFVARVVIANPMQGCHVAPSVRATMATRSRMRG